MEENTTLETSVKRCNTCGQEKPLTSRFFHKAKISSDGYRGKCKQCRCSETTAARDALRKVRLERKTQNLCVICGGQSRPGRVRCVACFESDSQLARRRYLRDRAEGLCEYCREPLATEEQQLHALCRGRLRGRERERTRQLINAGICYKCRRNPVTRGATLCARCEQKQNERRRRDVAKIKAQCYAAYGNQCACCGEKNSKFFTIDHVNNDGGKERREQRGFSGINLMRKLRTIKFPAMYQLLCWNCNLGKHIYKVCPHQES